MEPRGITRFWTEMSVYEIDFSRSLMRRLAGVRPPTAHQGTDGRWRAFVTTSPIQVGDPVLVTWDSLGDVVTPRTITSPIVGIAAGECGDPPAWVSDMIRSANAGGVDS